jgi:hypothetical protein
MDRGQVLATLEPVNNVRGFVTDSFAAVKRDGVMFLNGDEFGGAMPLTFQSQKALFSMAGLRRPTVERLTDTTATHVVNELLNRQPQLFVSDGQFITDILPPQEITPLKPSQICEMLEDIIPEHNYHRVLLHGNDVHIQSIGAERVPDVDVVKNSLIQAGVTTRFSPLGISLPQVQSFVVRLVCTNGMTGTEVLTSYQATEHENFEDWFNESVTDAYHSVGALVSKWDALVDEGIDPKDRVLVLSALMKEAKMPMAAREAVHARALEEPPVNAYDMLQLMSWASSHVLEQPRHILRTQDLATRFTNEETHVRLCPTCNHVR